MSNLEAPTDTMRRLTAALTGRYEIERELGVGGMSTVYLARDVRHERAVAIKVLRPDLAAAVGTERFLSEIRTTAHLQHAHILGLIDSGEVDGTAFYVMPFVAGESLKDRLAREKHLPVAEAVRIATALAGALDYAHRKGVIHRDIKPANILLHEGHAVIADFGIALALTSANRKERLTESGMSVGTPEYMSPEQAMGDRHLDGRTDIYSLGCVLYEMLGGEPPFTAATSQGVIAKVMTAEPLPIETLRSTVPANVAAALRTALSKVQADRFANAAEFGGALNDPRYSGPFQPAPGSLSSMRGRDLAGGAVIAALAVAALVMWLRPPAALHDEVTRFELVVPDSMFSPQVILDHDGTRLLWANRSGFYERRLDSVQIHKLRDPTPDTPALRDIGPTGKDVLMSGRGGMAIVSLAGGAPRALAIPSARSAAWGYDGFIYFAMSDSTGRTRAVARIPSDGGTVDTIASITGTVAEILPIPNGRGLILAINLDGVSALSVLDLGARKVHALGVEGMRPQYVEPGWLLFTNGTSLMAGRFDASRLVLRQKPVAVGSAGPGGTLLAARGHAMLSIRAPEQTASGIVIRSRTGVPRALPNVPDTIRFSEFALSPDGRRLAATGSRLFGGPPVNGPPSSNLYVYDFSSTRLTRLQSETRDRLPSWLPDGSALSFIRTGTDTPTTSMLMLRAWDGSTSPVSLLSRPGGGRGGPVLGPLTWLPDGRHAVLRVSPPGATAPGTPLGGNLMRLSRDSPTTLDTAVVTEYAESDPAVTRDGKLLAFTSDLSGRREVYVRQLAGGVLHRVSFGGGGEPRWAHGDNEMFYVNADTLFVARIRTGTELSPGSVRVVFIARNIGQGYAVLPGDTTFVTAAPSPASRLLIAVNFVNELERLVARP